MNIDIRLIQKEYSYEKVKRYNPKKKLFMNILDCLSKIDFITTKKTFVAFVWII